MAIPRAVKLEAQQLLDSKQPANLKLDKLNGLFLKNGLASYQTISCSQVMVHPSNRGGSMLNGHDVKAKGSQIMEQGFRLDLLEASCCAFELSKLPEVRKEQFDANIQLSKTQEGFLAPVQGNELYLSVGGSHTTAYLKAIAHGVVSLEENYMKQQNHPVQRAIDIGWKWLVLSSLLEEEFPSLPLFYSSSLNSSNSAHVAAGEMECLATIAQYVKLGKSLEQATELTKLGEPACKEYLDTISHFARLFAGGDQMPLVEFLSSFSNLVAK